MGHVQWYGYLILMILLCSRFPLQGQVDQLLDSLMELPDSAYCTKAYSKALIRTKNRYPLSPLGHFASSIRQSTYERYRCNNAINKFEKGLWIHYQDKEYHYMDQQLFTREDMNLVPVKKDQHDKFLKRTLKFLEKLERQSPYAKNMIQTLQESENKFIIDLSDRNSSYILFPLPNQKWGAINNNAYAFQAIEMGKQLVDYAPFNQIGSGAQIRWFPTHGILKLAHELSHAYDANFGLMDDRLISVNGGAMVAREIRALYHENIIRKEMNKDYRTVLKHGHAWIADDKPFTYTIPHLAGH